MSRFTSLMLVAAVALVLCGTSWAEEGKKPEDPSKRLENRFKKLDTNGDGKLSKEEFKSGLPEQAQAKADERFKKLDTDGDGSVSLDEFKAGNKKAEGTGEGKKPKKEKP